MTKLTTLSMVAVLAGTVPGCARGPATPRLEYYRQNPVERAYILPRTGPRECVRDYLQYHLIIAEDLSDATEIMTSIGWDCASHESGAVCNYLFSYFDAAVHRVYDPVFLRIDVDMAVNLEGGGEAVNVFDLLVDSVELVMSEAEYRAGIAELREVGDYALASSISLDDYFNNCQ